MRFSVLHETHYRYSAPVRFAPHLLRLNPRPASVRMISRVLTVRPKPVELVDVFDVHGNLITHVAFEGFSEELVVESRFELDTLGVPADDAGDLEPYRRNRDSDESVRLFAAEVAAGAKHDPLAFLGALTDRLYAIMDRNVRTAGAARSAATTLATREGACRDITVLFLAACRSRGLAARFVSGYQAQSQTPDGQRHLHAWAEVFVPGVGWSAWDPTHGVPVTDGHVALCSAPDQADTMPVEGSYYGPARTSTLDFSVRIATA